MGTGVSLFLLLLYQYYLLLYPYHHIVHIHSGLQRKSISVLVSSLRYVERGSSASILRMSSIETFGPDAITTVNPREGPGRTCWRHQAKWMGVFSCVFKVSLDLRPYQVAGYPGGDVAWMFFSSSFGNFNPGSGDGIFNFWFGGPRIYKYLVPSWQVPDNKAKEVDKFALKLEGEVAD